MWVKYFTPSGRSSWFLVPSQLWDWCAGVSLWQEYVSAFPTCFSVAFLLFAQCEVVITPVFSFSSLESVPYIAVDCRCVCENLWVQDFSMCTSPSWNGTSISNSILKRLLHCHMTCIYLKKNLSYCVYFLFKPWRFFWSLVLISLHIIYLNMCLCACSFA